MWTSAPVRRHRLAAGALLGPPCRWFETMTIIDPRPAVFIIGMEDGYRSSELERQLALQGLGWTHVDGVDLRRMPLSADNYVDQEAARILLRRDMSPGEIGCALAHRNVYKRILASDCEYAIVLEDDAVLVDRIDLSLVVDVLRSALPRMLQLRTNPSTSIVIPGQQLVAASGARAFRVGVPPTSTVGYAINRPAAMALIDNDRRVSNVADWPIRATMAIAFFAPASPPVTFDSSATSVIGSRATPLSKWGVRASRLSRLGRTVLHTTWFKHRELYGSYRTYFMHEFVRIPVYVWARHFGHSVNARSSEAPTAARRPLSAVLSRMNSAPAPAPNHGGRSDDDPM